MDQQYTYSEKPSIFTPRVLQITTIALRIVTTIFLFLSLIIIITKGTAKKWYNTGTTLYSYKLVGYQYMMATIILGGAYSIWQTITTVVRLKKGYPQGNLVLQYYADKVMTMALATGSVAGFVVTGELHRDASEHGSVEYWHKLFEMGYAADGLVFLGFICALILAELSSYAIRKKF